MKRFAKLLAAASVAVAGVGAGTAMAEDTLVWAGSGGGLAEVWKEVFDDPFTAETGVKVDGLATSDRASAIKAMMVAGRVTWDAAELPPVDYAIASANGWLEPLDWDKMDPNNMVPEAGRLPDAGIAATYSTIIAVRTDKQPDGQSMTGWADFWNVEKFPGGRALQNSVIENLEFALLADGVARDDLYKVLATPEGQDRAFAKLDEIKPHVVAWWTAGAQPVQMLSDGEVVYTTAWNGRITKLASDGTPAAIVWAGGALKPTYVVVIKGSKMVEAGKKYISFMVTDPKRAAKFASILPYPGMTKGLYDHIDPEVGKSMPTHPDNMSQQFVVNAKFWEQNVDALRERWEEWLLE
ncbi:ABC transporter substrate-binding protein [Rhodobacteraceae bacterium D3-12]|nr:ABC transporter substrate-binding protein [Rhodobacteraceae bacterium D3-12]